MSILPNENDRCVLAKPFLCKSENAQYWNCCRQNFTANIALFTLRRYNNDCRCDIENSPDNPLNLKMKNVKTLAAKRWYLQQVDKERSEPCQTAKNNTSANRKRNREGKSLEFSGAAMSGIKRLLLKYKHERIPKTSNGSKTSQRQWISALTGLVFLAAISMTRRLETLYVGMVVSRFLLSLTQQQPLIRTH